MTSIKDIQPRSKGIIRFISSLATVFDPPKPEKQSNSLWSVPSDELDKLIGASDKGRTKESQVKRAISKFPKWWENGIIVVSQYGGEDERILKASISGTSFRVLEVRNSRKSGRCSEEKRRNYKDMLFLEPTDGSGGLYKVYAGEAWVELVMEPAMLPEDEFIDDYDDPYYDQCVDAEDL